MGNRFKDWTAAAYQSRTAVNKYGATKTEFNGVKYDSKLEASHAQKLDVLRRVGELVKIERQVKIPLFVLGKLITTYKIDFIVTHRTGIREYIEVKGYMTKDWKIKWRLFEVIMAEQEPDAVLSIVTK